MAPNRPLLYKTYTAIIADRLGRWAQRCGAISPVQKGFMLAEGCLEHNFLVQQAIDEARDNGMDLQNAFGSVPHAAIFHLLEQHGAHPHLVEVIREAYSECTTTIQTADGDSGQAVTWRQGSSRGTSCRQ